MDFLTRRIFGLYRRLGYFGKRSGVIERWLFILFIMLAASVLGMIVALFSLLLFSFTTSIITGIVFQMAVGLYFGIDTLHIIVAEREAKEQGIAPPLDIPSFRQQLEARLSVPIMENNYVLPSEQQWNLIFAAAENICAVKEETPPIRLALPRPVDEGALQAHWDTLKAEWDKRSEYIFEAVIQSMTGYIANLKPHEAAPFQQPLQATPSMIWDVVEPFRAPHLKELGLCKWITDQYNRNVYSVSKSGKPPIQPQNYTGPPQDMATTYLRDTPLLPLFNVSVPYQPFSEINRCAHHWCLGKTRRGKTTFLRHLLRYDLTEVAQGNCSLVIIDSKDKGLVHEMRTLKQFGPGGELEGKLIVIDSDVAFPLNPFAMKDVGLARSIITYMLSGGMTELQAGALGFYVDTVLQGRECSFGKLMELIRLPSNSMPKDINDDELKKWWQSTRDKVHDATISGVEQRLANFMRDHKGAPVLKNLSADSWGLDLYKELHDGGKVLLVDTDHLKNGSDGTALMGRLFIALIENLASRRQKAAKPIWVVIDEASDYLTKTDPSFVQILIKAAGAKVGMTVAYQTKGLIDPTIEKALENAEIHSRCEQRGTVQLTVEERPLPPLVLSQLEFEREPQMLPDQYKELRKRLRTDYPYKAPPIVEPKRAFNPDADAV